MRTINIHWNKIMQWKGAPWKIHFGFQIVPVKNEKQKTEIPYEANHPEWTQYKEAKKEALNKEIERARASNDLFLFL